MTRRHSKSACTNLHSRLLLEVASEGFYNAFRLLVRLNILLYASSVSCPDAGFYFIFTNLLNNLELEPRGAGLVCRLKSYMATLSGRKFRMSRALASVFSEIDTPVHPRSYLIHAGLCMSDVLGKIGKKERTSLMQFQLPFN